MSLLYGPGENDSIDWRSRIEYLMRVVASGSGGGGGGMLDPRLDNLAAILAAIVQIDTAGSPANSLFNEVASIDTNTALTLSGTNLIVADLQQVLADLTLALIRLGQISTDSAATASIIFDVRDQAQQSTILLDTIRSLIDTIQANSLGLTSTSDKFTAVDTGSGYTRGDRISRISIWDKQGALVARTWQNVTTGVNFVNSAPSDIRAGEVVTQSSVTTIAASATPVTVLSGTLSLRMQTRIVNNSDRIFYGIYGNYAPTANPVPSATNFTFALAPLTATPLTPTGLASSEVIEANCGLPILGVWAPGATGNLIITEFR